MKPAKVIIESHLERELRLKRKEETDNLLRSLELRSDASWDDAADMLGWYWAMKPHGQPGRMDTPPAIDPAREIVQGLRVDREERLGDIGHVQSALAHLMRRQGNGDGYQLLWLHFRCATPTGRKTKAPDGRLVDEYGNPSVPIRELGATIGRPQKQTIAEYWRAFGIVEDFAFGKHWVRARVERVRRSSAVRVYRRPPDEGGGE